MKCIGPRLADPAAPRHCTRRSHHSAVCSTSLQLNSALQPHRRCGSHAPHHSAIILVVIYLNTGDSPGLQRTAAEVTPEVCSHCTRGLHRPATAAAAARGRTRSCAANAAIFPGHRRREGAGAKAPARAPPPPPPPPPPPSPRRRRRPSARTCRARRGTRRRSRRGRTCVPASIDWKGMRSHGTGVRGERRPIEYIMPKYCDPTPRAGPFRRSSGWRASTSTRPGWRRAGWRARAPLGNRSLLVRRAHLDGAMEYLTIHLSHRPPFPTHR